MTGTEFLNQLLELYKSAYDIICPYEIKESYYDAYASFNVTSSKYVLVKKAELWRADCFEHTFFKCRDKLSGKDLRHFKEDIIETIEPKLVRKGESSPPAHHMYTYITGIFICEEAVSKEVRKEIKSFTFFKNYSMGFRGYVQGRLLVFDRKSRKLYGNRAAKDLIKGYKKVF